MPSDTRKAEGVESRREWLATLWPIVAAAGWLSFGAVWFGGRLDTTVSQQQSSIGQLYADLDKQRTENLLTRSQVLSAADERQRQLVELERRITDKSDLFNEKIASSLATNQATRDMLMMLEHRMEVIEVERRTGK